MRRITTQLNIRRSMALILATLLLAALLVPSLSVPVSAAESGTCGEELAWSLSAGILTITGQGDMDDYNDMDLQPWDAFKDQIRRVILPDGLTSVGNRAFYECANLVAVTIPDTVKDIGAYAFGNCESLALVQFGNHVESIGVGAFRNCVSLDGVRLPIGLTKIGDKAFYRCESLTSITIPQAVQDMGSSVFAYCENLVSVTCYARIKLLPEWTFYGCNNLTGVVLAETVVNTGNYAFKDCDILSTIYYSGNETNAESIKQDIAQDVPGFDNYGSVSDGVPPQVNYAGKTLENSDGTVTQVNTSVQENKNSTVVTQVAQTRPAETTSGGSYTASVKVTVENKDGWAEVAGLVTDSLKHINDAYATNSQGTAVDVTVYMKQDDKPDDGFVKDMAGRDVELTIVSPKGSSWQLDCSDLKSEDITGDCNYSYELSPSDEKITEQLKTEDCYQLTFEQSANVNAEVLIQLPQIPAHSNAYLYQVENDGSMTRLQATVVDQNGNAHFYLASVNKDTEYIVGVNVPGENADDAIIPDELLPQYGSAVDRLQKIDYVITGHESSWGLNAAQVTWIMLGVLAVCIIIVGTVMAVWNQRRLKRGYVPDMSEYEDPIPVGATAAGAAVAPMVAYEAVGSAETEEPAEPAESAEPAEPVEADVAADETAAEESEA